MQFIDTHIHLQDYNAKDAPHFIAKIQEMGFQKVVCPATKEEDWSKVAELTNDFSDFIVPAFGLHPWYLSDAKSDWQKRLHKILLQYPQAWVGECGLDRIKNTEEKLQKQFFQDQLEIACLLKRPLIIHAVKANSWLEEFSNQLKCMPFVVHSFSGSTEFLQYILALGGYISYSPKVLNRSKGIDLVKQTPLEKMFLESDGPYQGNSEDVVNLYCQVAQIHHIDLSDLSLQYMANYKEITDDR